MDGEQQLNKTSDGFHKDALDAPNTDLQAMNKTTNVFAKRPVDGMLPSVTQVTGFGSSIVSDPMATQKNPASVTVEDQDEDEDGPPDMDKSKSLKISRKQSLIVNACFSQR